jgi:hypothetical protein
LKGFFGIGKISKKRAHSFTASIIVFSAVFVKLNFQMFVDIFGTFSIITTTITSSSSSSSPPSSPPTPPPPPPSLLLLSLQSLVDLSLFFNSLSTKHICYGGGIVSPTLNPQPAGPVYPFLFVCLGHHL